MNTPASFLSLTSPLSSLFVKGGSDASRAIGVRESSEFGLVEHHGNTRSIAEAFIAQRFAQSFGASVKAFMPRLFTLRDSAGVVCGAFGLRSPNHRLFIEQYLDEPIEVAIAQHSQCAIERRAVIEVGHFCGAFPGAMRQLIALLATQLHREGFEWVAFTSTTGLRNAFFRVGLHPVDLAAAAVEKLLPDERASWGRYYEHAPRVSVGRIEDGVRAPWSGREVNASRPRKIA